MIRENGKRLGALIPPDLFEHYQFYEKEHWAQSARDNSPSLLEEN